jgi:hypothetical protein
MAEISARALSRLVIDPGQLLYIAKYTRSQGETQAAIDRLIASARGATPKSYRWLKANS